MKSFTGRKRQNEEMALQITSMADIFTIILVFLLKSYATSAVTLSPENGTLLPQAHAQDRQVEALKVELNATTVLIEGSPVVQLKNYKFESGDLQGNGSSQTLTKALEKQRQKQLMIAKSNADVQVDPKILVVADQRTPYSTIKSVLASAAIQGYTDFKLAVIRGE